MLVTARNGLKDPFRFPDFASKNEECNDWVPRRKLVRPSRRRRQTPAQVFPRHKSGSRGRAAEQRTAPAKPAWPPWSSPSARSCCSSSGSERGSTACSSIRGRPWHPACVRPFASPQRRASRRRTLIAAWLPTPSAGRETRLQTTSTPSVRSKRALAATGKTSNAFSCTRSLRAGYTKTCGAAVPRPSAATPTAR